MRAHATRPVPDAGSISLPSAMARPHRSEPLPLTLLAAVSAEAEVFGLIAAEGFDATPLASADWQIARRPKSCRCCGEDGR
jgi:hypothetical protein